MSGIRVGRLVALLSAVLPAATVRAQSVPHRLSFSGHLVDGELAADGLYDLTFALYDAPTAGNQVCGRWAESHPDARVEAGLIFLELGALTPLPTDCFSGAPLYLEVTVDAVALSPRLTLGTSAYAVRAEVAGDAATVGGMSPDDLLPVGNTLYCQPGDKVIGLNGDTGDVICAADLTAAQVCADNTYLSGSGTCDPGFLDADGVDATAATLCNDGAYLNGDGTCDAGDGSGDCAAGSVCTGGHSHSDKLATSGGTISGDLTVSGILAASGGISWGGNPFSSGTRGYLAVIAYSSATCDTVCTAHGLICSGLVGPYLFPTMANTTCDSTTGERLCGCFGT